MSLHSTRTQDSEGKLDTLCRVCLASSCRRLLALGAATPQLWAEAKFPKSASAGRAAASLIAKRHLLKSVDLRELDSTANTALLGALAGSGVERLAFTFTTPTFHTGVLLLPRLRELAIHGAVDGFLDTLYGGYEEFGRQLYGGFSQLTALRTLELLDCDLPWDGRRRLGVEGLSDLQVGGQVQACTLHSAA